MKFSVSDKLAILVATGEPATLTEPGSVGPPIIADKITTLQVKFSNKSMNEMGVLTSQPQVTLDATALDGVNLKTARLTISGQTYKMINPMPDDGGFMILHLNKA